ncbi:unnamed protein product [Lactuca saligna]|uniref:Protein kinase domain-containing protein n=1 Tax=Lactuca saligna TaxID=75948 RepID=A0AA36ECT7_LACSI|nr:unnamed protein product [Lactuca saligna]
MKCFSIFSSRTKRKGKSSPELQEQNPSTKPPTRLVNSTGSITSPLLYKEEGHVLRKFSFSELKNATNNFNRSLWIKNGQFGNVYKGFIQPVKPADDQGAHLLLVAITKLYNHSMQEHKEWLSGVEFLGVVEHPNLVKLLGYCLVDDEKERQSQRLLVYEYMPNKSLNYHLFNTASPPIPWMKRLQILLGSAQGLAYLHEGLETQVLFGDFNSGDVLLDENFNPKLSDFGLERGQVRNLSYVRTVSFYASPEYVHCGHLKSNSDSWSFGIVLYEVLSGRRVIDRNLPQSQQMLTNWVKQFPADSKIFWKMIDPRLADNQYSLSGARKVAKLADSCMRNNPEDRPTMNEIVDVLHESIRDSEDERQNPLPESST